MFILKPIRKAGFLKEMIVFRPRSCRHPLAQRCSSLFNDVRIIRHGSLAWKHLLMLVSGRVPGFPLDLSLDTSQEDMRKFTQGQIAHIEASHQMQTVLVEVGIQRVGYCRVRGAQVIDVSQSILLRGMDKLKRGWQAAAARSGCA